MWKSSASERDFPCVLPSRITDSLCSMLKKYHPIYLNTHFNHPREVTPQAKEACERLANAGIPLGCQTVLMKGVNDDPVVLKELMHKLLMMRVRPYYLYQADLTRGTNHFRTRVETGLQVMQALRGHTPDLRCRNLSSTLPPEEERSRSCRTTSSDSTRKKSF